MGNASGSVEDRYYMQKVKLGQGSFGAVWRAIDKHTDKFVAIKQLDKAAMPRRGVRRQDIEREISVMQALEHENITRLLASFEDARSIYLALEYCADGDFGDKVKERGLRLTEREAATWMRQILSAIHCLHQKAICHRDIKPDNFMVHQGVLKLADFGLAVFVEKGRLLVEKCGTPAFMAPEQHQIPRFSRGYTVLVDVWAGGVTMYMLLFGGKHPFLGPGKNLDEKRLMEGRLDFSAQEGFFSGFVSDNRFSEPARRLCRSLVEPQPARRTPAAQACQDPWLRLAEAQGQEAEQGVASRQSVAASPSATRICVEAPRRSRTSEASPSSTEKRPSGVEEKTKLQRELQEEKKRAEALEAVVRLQHEQNEAQWEALLHNNKVMERLKEEKQQLADTQRQACEGGVLSPGTKCRYVTRSGVSHAIIEGYSGSDGTFVLNIQPEARPEDIFPAGDVTRAEAWPCGALVLYESSSVRAWLPAVILSFNEGDGDKQGTYNLDLRGCASVDRIRMRPRALPPSNFVSAC